MDCYATTSSGSGSRNKISFSIVQFNAFFLLHNITTSNITTLCSYALLLNSQLTRLTVSRVSKSILLWRRTESSSAADMSQRADRFEHHTSYILPPHLLFFPFLRSSTNWVSWGESELTLFESAVLYALLDRHHHPFLLSQKWNGMSITYY